MKDSQGTEYFMSPESHDAGHDGKLADIWALGVTIYAFAYLKVPFLDQEEVRGNALAFPTDRHYGEGFVDFL